MENTATQAQTFKQRISKLSELSLREMASEEFGLNIDGQLKKEVIIEQLLKIYEKTRNIAKALNEDSAALFLAADKNERLISVKFIPFEFPNAPEEFCYDGGLGVGKDEELRLFKLEISKLNKPELVKRAMRKFNLELDSKKSKEDMITELVSVFDNSRVTKRLSKVARFKLVPGETYDLPIRVVKHLEGLIYRDSKPIIDENTGMIMGNIPVIKPRFMMQVILSDSQMREMGAAT